VPGFRFTARSDGRYSYEGRDHVEPLGERTARFPEYLFDRLAELSADLDILGLADDYPAFADDLPIMPLKVRHAGGSGLSETRPGTPARSDSGGSRS
jgi:hypothetical protein